VAIAPEEERREETDARDEETWVVVVGTVEGGEVWSEGAEPLDRGSVRESGCLLVQLVRCT
jgi:hypothetical protein